MTTGANFKVTNGRMLWHKPLISGDELLIQSHEARMSARQGSYLPFPEYGNPFVDTLTEEISEVERNMRLVSETKQCTLQDGRFIDSIVDETTIEIIEGILNFQYELFKRDGGSFKETFPFFSRGIIPVDPIEPVAFPYYNLISEDGRNFITEDGKNLVTELIF